VSAWVLGSAEDFDEEDPGVQGGEDEGGDHARRDPVEGAGAVKKHDGGADDEGESLELAPKYVDAFVDGAMVDAGALHAFLSGTQFDEPGEDGGEEEFEAEGVSGLGDEGVHAGDEDEQEIGDGSGGAGGEIVLGKDAVDIDGNGDDGETGESGSSTGGSDEEVGPHEREV
jgi:hypothetical protein